MLYANALTYPADERHANLSVAHVTSAAEKRIHARKEQMVFHTTTRRQLLGVMVPNVSIAMQKRKKQTRIYDGST